MVDRLADRSVRTAVVGASSGLGRCIGVGLAARGEPVALMARRRDRLERAAAEAGDRAVAIECDVTDAASCKAAFTAARSALGGIDAVVYTPAIGPLARLVDVDTDTWRRAFETNVIGAAHVTAAAIPHLTETKGIGIYLSSVSASLTPPWPGLGAYVVTKAALDKLVEAWRVEHPELGFTCLVVGDCGGGDGDSRTGFIEDWDPELAAELGALWFERGLVSGSLIDVEDLVDVVDAILRTGASASLPRVTVAPRTQPPER